MFVQARIDPIQPSDRHLQPTLRDYTIAVADKIPVRSDIIGPFTCQNKFPVPVLFSSANHFFCFFFVNYWFVIVHLVPYQNSVQDHRFFSQKQAARCVYVTAVGVYDITRV